MIPLAIAGAGFLGNLFGSMKSAEANNRAFDFLKQKQADLNSAYNQDYYKDYMNTVESRSAIKRFQEGLRKMNPSLNNSAVKTGATPESVVATGGRMTDSYADFMNNMAGKATAHKQRVKDMYEQRKSALEGQEFNILQNKASQWDNFGQNVSNTSGSLLNAWANGAFDGKPKSNASNPFKTYYDKYNMGNGNVSIGG